MSSPAYPYTLRRVAATLIDYTILFGISFFYIIKVGAEISPGYYSVRGVKALFPEAFWFAFIMLTERFMDGTLGHQICGIKVVSMDGNELTFFQVVLRRMMDLFDICLSFGLIAFVLVKATDGNQRIGDLVAKTRVIGKNDEYRVVKFDFEK
jgi:uncharacterized RDD family membrane protein YckC